MSSDRKLLVFLSSTSDLKAERDAIAVPMAMDVYRYENDRARGVPPRTRLRQVLEQSNAFVSLHGASYGSLYPGCDDDKAIVQWEFETAREIGRAEMFPFVKANLPANVDPRQQAFLTSLQNFNHGSWVKTFDSPAQLGMQVSDSLYSWLAEFAGRALEAQDRRSSRPIERLPFLIILFCTMGVALATATGTLSQAVALALCTVLTLATLACMALM
jgi:hypothetical protein